MFTMVNTHTKKKKKKKPIYSRKFGNCLFWVDHILVGEILHTVANLFSY